MSSELGSHKEFRLSNIDIFSVYDMVVVWTITVMTFGIWNEHGLWLYDMNLVRMFEPIFGIWYAGIHRVKHTNGSGWFNLTVLI